MNNSFLRLLLVSTSVMMATRAMEEVDPDLAAALEASRRETGIVPLVRDHAGEDPDLAAGIAASLHEVDAPVLVEDEFERARIESLRISAEQEHQLEQEATLRAISLSEAEAERAQAVALADAREKISTRRLLLKDQRRRFQLARSREMDERARDMFRSECLGILLSNALLHEEPVLKQICDLDKSFFKNIELKKFATSLALEQALEQFLERRLTLHLSFVQGQPEFEALIREDEVLDSLLIRADVEEDIAQLERQERAQRLPAPAVPRVDGRGDYETAVSESLTVFLQDTPEGGLPAFKEFLSKSIGLPIESITDIIDRNWEIKDVILASLREQEAPRVEAPIVAAPRIEPARPPLSLEELRAQRLQRFGGGEKNNV